ncbi:MAG: hypothetical protein Fur0037_12350 [Planctomycetota bacterium]
MIAAVHGLLRLLLLGAAALACGLLANALRTSGGIEVLRDYFGSGEPGAPSAAGGLRERAGAEFVLIGVRDALRSWSASRVDPTLVLFLDARGRAAFEGGRVPGAVLADYYDPPRILTEFAPLLAAAPVSRFVVYCESDECEDGFLLCRFLRDSVGVDPSRIRLFLGGMRAWRRAGGPLAKGLLP